MTHIAVALAVMVLLGCTTASQPQEQLAQTTLAGIIPPPIAVPQAPSSPDTSQVERDVAAMVAGMVRAARRP